MKLGIGISIGILLFLGGLFYFMFEGAPNIISKETNAKMLEAQQLPDSLPSLFTTIEPDDDAGGIYLKTVRMYTRNQRRLSGDRPDKDLIVEIEDLLQDAMDAGRVTQPFLDDQIPWTTAPTPEFEGALEGILDVMTVRAQAHFDANDDKEILKTARVTFAFGYRLFKHCKRLYNRRVGMDMMESALSWMGSAVEWIDDGEAKLQAWESALLAVRDSWNTKIKIVHSVKPHIGDLLNIAKNDQDITFRAAALLHLGIAKFNPGNAGNKRAIDNAIEEALQNGNEMIAKAAQGAKDFTKEELRKVR